MPQEYEIVWAGDPEETQYGSKVRIKFRGVEEYLNIFTKYPGNIKNGEKLYGEIFEVQKGDKTYKNFRFGKKPDRGPAASNGATSEIKNILTLQIMPLLEKMNKEILSMSAKVFPDDSPPF